MLNRIVLIGRLTRDPELRYTPANGVAVASFTLAVNRRFSSQGGQKEADFIPIVVWRAQAENCAKYLGKGSLVAVEGRLQIRSYEDREGQKRTATEVVADSVQFLDTKEKRSFDGPPAFDDSMIGEDDVPF
ncbi:single-stranded DNA-binding protein [Dethiobacter alkaliphilus]|uniref:Single-stranded DNA-binding protein n=1 Tax=Dethiobacter alkaliphilus AHT 1 TaxID=555088 RepID=C0GI94_DETAL|nr:single-stranded DNA-binding protein [Dethiobacter alkaliphilus]EEG76942.1 single-strand binding protein [Dethiobacter alkaliphilus AHT 1]